MFTHNEHYRFPVFITLLSIALFSFFIDQSVKNIFDSLYHPILFFILVGIANIYVVTIALYFIPLIVLIRKHKYVLATMMSLSITTAFLLSLLLKEVIARPRPPSGLVGVPDVTLFSFPSTHAMLAFSLVPFLLVQFPQLRKWIMAYAFVIIMSRLFFQVHYLSDVVWGAIIGCLIGWVILTSSHYGSKNKN